MTTPHPPFSSRLRAVVAACAAVGLLALAGCGGSEPDNPPTTAASGPAEYVALGDSYTAESGDGPYVDDPCFRATQGYPFLVAKRLGITSFANVSCGGATSENLTSTQYPTNGQNPPQLQAVTKKATLVTLGMGLNDEKLSAIIVYSCLASDPSTNPVCKAYLDATDAQLNELIAKIGDHVAEDIKEIKAAAAPDVRVILVGYPRGLADGKTCSSQLPLPNAASARYRIAGARVNDTLKSVAKSAGADFIDMYAASKGHELCSKSPWVNGQHEIPGEAKAFHPFPAYHVAVADKIAALLGK
jgi:lysophospholipase L1-like esterase